MQHQIVLLENKLRLEDERCMANRLDNGTFEHDESEMRNQILPQLSDCIRNYRTWDIFILLSFPC